MSANASEGRISMTVRSIMAESSPSPRAAAAADYDDDHRGGPEEEAAAASATTTTPTPASNVSQPSPSSATPSEPSRRKRPLPDGPRETPERRPPPRRTPEARRPFQSRASVAAAAAAAAAETQAVEAAAETQAAEAAARAAVTAATPTDAANRRRSHKVSRACDFCKAKKLKCSGTIPCQVCTKKRLSCIYDASYRRGRPPTPPPAPPEGFEAHRGTLPVYTPSETARSYDTPRFRTPLLLATAPSASGSTTRPRSLDSSLPSAEPETAGLEGLEESIQPTSRASPEVEIAEIEGQYVDTTSSLTFLHRAWKRLSSQRSAGGGVPSVPSMTSGGERHQSMTTAGDKPFAVATTESWPIPERHVCLEMLTFYFDVCVVTYRCLHQGLVKDWLNTLLDNVRERMPPEHAMGHAKASVVMTIFAIVTLRQTKVKGEGPASPDEHSDHRRGDYFFCQATRLTDAETGLPKLESAQARLLQVLYLLQTSRMNQAWYVFGSILPIISALGLHRKSSRKRATAGGVGGGGQGSQADYIASQCRKRTFWVAYTIDKYLAVVFGRPSMYHDQDIDQDFPDCVNDEDMTPQGRSTDEPEMDCHLDSLVFHARLAQLIHGISRDVYSIKPVARHERLQAARRYGRALHDWRESLPHHLGTVRPMSLIPSFRRQNTALKLAYCHAVMHANRPFLLGATAAAAALRGEALGDSVEECIGAAKTALETVDAMAGDGTLFYAFWWTPYVTFCALTVVYVWKIQRREEDVVVLERGLFELADRCQNHLAKATTSDSPGRRYSVILEELRDEAMGQQPGRGRRVTSEGHQDRGFAHQREMSEQVAAAAAADPMQVDASSGSGVPSADMGAAVFQPQGLEGMTNLLAGWETTDWLDLDSSAFATFPDLEASPVFWMPPAP